MVRSSDKNVYLNMRPRLVEQLGMIRTIEILKGLGDVDLAV